jgi:hypothetical protein
MIHLILIVIAALAVYVLLVLARPHRKCPRSHGTRRTEYGKPKGKRRIRRTRPCRRCMVNGAPRGTIQRLGARTIHRWYWSVAGDRRREHRRDEINEQVTTRRNDHV